MILNGKLINPGEFNTKLELVRIVTSQDAGGFYHTVEVESKQVWSHWKNIFGNEAILAAAQGVEISATVRIRFLTSLDNTWQVRKGGESYEIVTSVEDIGEKHEYMEFKVRRIEAG